MEEEARPYRALIRYGALVLMAAVAVECAVEVHRASAAMSAWICETTPTPAGPQACQAAFIVRWMTARLPLYVVAVGIAAVLLSAVRATLRRSPLEPFPWNRLLRVLTVVVCLIALSELVACAGDASCGLSVSCT